MKQVCEQLTLSASIMQAGAQVVQVHKSTSELGTLPYTGQPAGPQWCLAVWRGSTVFLSTEDHPYEYIFHH